MSGGAEGEKYMCLVTCNWGEGAEKTILRLCDIARRLGIRRFVCVTVRVFFSCRYLREYCFGLTVTRGGLGATIEEILALILCCLFGIQNANTFGGISVDPTFSTFGHYYSSSKCLAYLGDSHLILSKFELSFGNHLESQTTPSGYFPCR